MGIIRRYGSSWDQSPMYDKVTKEDITEEITELLETIEDLEQKLGISLESERAKLRKTSSKCKRMTRSQCAYFFRSLAKPDHYGMQQTGISNKIEQRGPFRASLLHIIKPNHFGNIEFRQK